MLTNILVLKDIGSTKKLKMFSISPIYQHLRDISGIAFFQSRISLICLIYLSLPNLYFYTIRPVTMFFKFQSAYTNLDYFLLLTHSRLQNSWSY